MEWLIYIAREGDVDASFNAWAMRQGDRMPYCLDCGFSHGRIWVKVKA